MVASRARRCALFRMIKFLGRWLVIAATVCAERSFAQVLYDGALGLPASQGWTYFATGGTQISTNGGVLLDTTAANSYQGGYSLTAPVGLNRTNGFTLAFTSRMIAEAHANANRAGFSVILLAEDKHGIELAFWTNTIFAQSDSPLFTHAEETNFSTATAFVDYALTLRPTSYVLLANGAIILTGPIRDYEAFGGFPNVYVNPNFIFFGDDTTSAGGAFNLKKIILVTASKVSITRNRQISWSGVSNQNYTVLTSSNLANWIPAQTVTSATTNFSYTNNSSATSQFFRVSYP